MFRILTVLAFFLSAAPLHAQDIHGIKGDPIGAKIASFSIRHTDNALKIKADDAEFLATWKAAKVAASDARKAALEL